VHLLFPTHPLAPTTVDPDFAAQASAASAAGWSWSLVSFEALVNEGAPGRAVRRVLEGAGPCLYRGWMLKPAAYAALAGALADRGAPLVVTPDAYVYGHHLSGWYADFREVGDDLNSGLVLRSFRPYPSRGVDVRTGIGAPRPRSGAVLPRAPRCGGLTCPRYIPWWPFHCTCRAATKVIRTMCQARVCFSANFYGLSSRKKDRRVAISTEPRIRAVGSSGSGSPTSTW